VAVWASEASNAAHRSGNLMWGQLALTEQAIAALAVREGTTSIVS